MGKWIKILKGCLSIYPCANLPSRWQRCVWKMQSWPGTSCRSRWESAAGLGTRWWPAGSAPRRWREASRLCTGKTPWRRKLGCYLVLLVSFLGRWHLFWLISDSTSKLDPLSILKVDPPLACSVLPAGKLVTFDRLKLANVLTKAAQFPRCCLWILVIY